MTKEILDSIISTMDFNDLFELAESHLCGLYVIKNKDRDLLRKEYGLKFNDAKYEEYYNNFNKQYAGQ